MIICVLTSEDWRARFQKCSNPVVLVQPNVGKKWRVLHIPRGSQTTTAHCTNHRSVSGYTPQTWSSRVLLIVAGGGNIGTLLHGCHTSNAREMTCRCWCWILHLTRAPLSSTRCPQPAEQSSSAVSIAKMFCLSGHGGHAASQTGTLAGRSRVGIPPRHGAR